MTYMRARARVPVPPEPTGPPFPGPPGPPGLRYPSPQILQARCWTNAFSIGRRKRGTRGSWLLLCMTKKKPVNFKLLIYSNSSSTAAEKQICPLSTVRIHHRTHRARQLRQFEPLCETCRDSASGHLVQLNKGITEDREVPEVICHLSSLCSLMARPNRAQRRG